MNFHEVRFPAAMSFGSLGGPERRTEIVTLSNGFEERNSPWSQSRRRYDAGLGMRNYDELAEVIAFFEARCGQLFGFRWKDWTDFKSCAPSREVSPIDQELGLGDDSRRVFGLVKHYRSDAQSVARRISKPVPGRVVVALGGAVIEQGQGCEVDHTTGEVIFDVPPPAGAPVTAGFEFDVPVRFGADRIEASYAAFAAGEIPSVPIVEVRV